MKQKNTSPKAKEDDSPKSVRQWTQEQTGQSRYQGIATEEPAQVLDGNTKFAAQGGKQRNQKLIVNRGQKQHSEEGGDDHCLALILTHGFQVTGSGFQVPLRVLSSSSDLGVGIWNFSGSAVYCL